MNKLLLVVDVQNAFINDNTKHILNKISNLIDNSDYNTVIFTRFINDENSIYHKKLNYRRCIHKEDNIIPIDTKDYLVLDKRVYSAFNDDLIKITKENNIDEIDLCGIDTECCILKTALDLFENGYNVFVLKDYCASTGGLIRHNNALKIIEKCIGKSYLK